MIFREDSGLLRDTDIRSILRYLGFKGGEVPPAAQKELDRCFEEMQDKAELRAEARLFPLRFLSEEHFLWGIWKYTAGIWEETWEAARRPI